MSVITPTVWSGGYWISGSPSVATAGGGLLLLGDGTPYLKYADPLGGERTLYKLGTGPFDYVGTLPDYTPVFVSGSEIRLLDRNLTWKSSISGFSDIGEGLHLTANQSGVIGAVTTRSTDGSDPQVYFSSMTTGFDNAIIPHAPNSDRNFGAVISSLDDGNFMVSWQREDSIGNATIMVSIVTPTGTILDERAVSSPAVGIYNPEIEILSNGNTIITWKDSSSSRVYYQIVDSSGADVGTPHFLTHDAGSNPVKLVALDDGGFLVGWTKPGEKYMGEVGTEWYDHDIFIQCFDADGNEVGTFSQLAYHHSEDQLLGMLELSDGRVAVHYRQGIEFHYMIIDPREDTIVGGSDQDTIYGRIDGSTIIGNGGDDLLFGMGAVDHLLGGTGADQLNGGAQADLLEGGAGNDIYFVDNAGDVVSEAAAGSDGIDEVRTTVSYTLASIAVGGMVENLLLMGTTQNINGVGNAIGNTITGNHGDNRLSGLGGNDRLVASYGNDILIGGSGNDALFGTYGDDTLNGGLGADYLSGGDGRDRASYSDATAGVVANLLNPSLNTGAAKGDTYYSIEILNGSAFNDRLGGDNTANELWGLDGNDYLGGRNGDDILKGDNGRDTLVGGQGADKLYGGSGADTFLFESYKQSVVSSRDTIVDFSRADGDKIDISAIDARSTTTGNQAFTFIGTAAFSESAGELRYFKKDGYTYVYGDLNGDAGIDFSIRLNGVIDLKSSDFIL